MSILNEIFSSHVIGLQPIDQILNNDTLNKLQSMQKEYTDIIDKIRETNTENRIKFRKVRALEKSASNMKEVIKAVLDKAMPYLVLILVIILIISGGVLLFGKGKKNNKTSKSRFSFHNLLPLGASNFLKKFNSGDGIKPSKRYNYHAGRCDNIQWVEKSTSNKPSDGIEGKCNSTTIPNPIIWEIDPQKIDGYYNLPSEVRDHFINDYGGYIVIPYELYDTFYMPNCDKAMFCKDKEGKETTKSASFLLKDAGISCKLVSTIVNPFR